MTTWHAVGTHATQPTIGRHFTADERSEETAALYLLDIAQVGRLVPTGTPGSSNVQRLKDYGYSLTLTEVPE